jgi:hypothetical protein
LFKNFEIEIHSYLLSSSRLDEVGLWNDLHGVVLVRIKGGAHVNLRKASLSNHSTAKIVMNGVTITVGFSALLLKHNVLVCFNLGRAGR